MIENIHKNLMGTTSFDGKFGRMRKAQDFVVYPLQKGDSVKVIHVQSKNRWAEINLETNVLTLSASHSHANSFALSLDIVKGKAEKVTMTKEELNPLLDHIRGTASPMAGGNNCLSMYCDNSQANQI